MAGDSNQSPRVTTGFLNTVNDPAPGVPLSSPSGSIVQPYTGQVGGKLTLRDEDALKLSDVTNVATLYNGIYTYVQTKSGSSTAPARGLVAFWYDRGTYIVTPDGSATNISKPAGVYLNAPTKGQYCFIQVAGKASAKFTATITKATPADGDLVVINSSTYLADVLADATNLTSVEAKTIIGICDGAPTGGAISLVDLWRNFDNEF
jgi:hypothetical protein